MVKRKIFEAKDVKLRNSEEKCNVIVYITDVYPFLVEINKGGTPTYVAYFSEDALGNFLSENGLVDDWRKKAKDSGIDLSFLEDFYSSESVKYTKFPYTPKVGDRVLSKVYLGRREGVVESIEHTSKRRIPIYWVKWNDGETTPELPFNLMPVIEEVGKK